MNFRRVFSEVFFIFTNKVHFALIHLHSDSPYSTVIILQTPPTIYICDTARDSDYAWEFLLVCLDLTS